MLDISRHFPALFSSSVSAVSLLVQTTSGVSSVILTGDNRHLRRRNLDGHLRTDIGRFNAGNTQRAGFRLVFDDRTIGKAGVICLR